MDTIHTEERNGLTINIAQDLEPQSPREWDNLGHMICFHSRYTLGDKHNFSTDEFNGWEEMEIDLKTQYEAVVVLPLYLYDHSGISMRTYRHGHHASWDCGCVGFIYVTKGDIIKEYDKVTKKTIARAEKVLIGEVEEYNDYLTGNVYGYIIEDKDGENLESCWGFSGDYEKGALKEAQSLVDHMTNNGKTDHTGQLLMKI